MPNHQYAGTRTRLNDDEERILRKFFEENAASALYLSLSLSRDARAGSPSKTDRIRIIIKKYNSFSQEMKNNAPSFLKVISLSSVNVRALFLTNINHRVNGIPRAECSFPRRNPADDLRLAHGVFDSRINFEERRKPARQDAFQYRLDHQCVSRNNRDLNYKVASLVISSLVNSKF